VKVKIAKLIKMNQDQILKKNYDANREYYALLPLLKSRIVLRAEKVKIYKDISKTSGNVCSRILYFVHWVQVLLNSLLRLKEKF